MISDSPDTKTELLAIRSISQKHPHNAHVILVHDFWLQINQRQHFSRTFIQIERCEGNLEEYLTEVRNSNQNIEPLELADIMNQILNDLSHCHKNDIYHRDLKLSNNLSCIWNRWQVVLYSNNECYCHSSALGKRWLLTDFGFSTIFGPKSKTFSHNRRGTAVYHAPELAEYTYDALDRSEGGVVSLKSDIWAIGCILFRLATTNKRPAFVNDYEMIAYKKEYEGHSLPQLTETQNPNLKREAPTPDEDLLPFWQLLNTILEHYLARNPDKRVTAADLQAWFEAVMQDMIDREKSEITMSKLVEI